MNKAILIGRLTADPEHSTTANGVSMCRFTLAVNRPYKTQEGQELTDFIPIVVWRAQADNCAKYLSKGRQCCVEGAINVRTFEKNGERRYMTEVTADAVEFLGGGQQNSGGDFGGNAGARFQKGAAAQVQQSSVDSLQPADDDDNLPF